jgi:hypothetical protein
MERDLDGLVKAFAAGMKAADARAPRAVNQRSGTPYQPGLGPHPEARTVALVMEEIASAAPDGFGEYRLGVPYAAGSQQKCDLCLGTAPQWSWAIEVKMIRMLGENGKPNDNLPTHILSPYPQHRSALTDCGKLLASALAGRKAILMFGYEYEGWPLEPLAAAFETLARRRVALGERRAAAVTGLLHPIHRCGAVLAWEIGAR